MINVRLYRFLNRNINRWRFLYGKKGVVVLGKGIVSKSICSCAGDGNVILLDAGCSIKNCNIVFKGNNNKLILRPGCHISDVTFWLEDDGNKIEIGERTSIEGGSQFAALEGTSILVGNDCMFANNVNLRTSDSHSIFNGEGKRINKAANITIGDHVWAGFEVIILKGCSIPKGTVLGARSIVTSSSKLMENSIIAGAPAKIIRENIHWKREKHNVFDN